jgi:hypothetical protein
MIQRPVDPVKDATLCVIKVIVRATRPNKPFHTLDVDVGRAPKVSLAEVGKVQLDRHTALTELRDAAGILSFAFGIAEGRNNMLTRIAMMAMTTNSSISVNAT